MIAAAGAEAAMLAWRALAGHGVGCDPCWPVLVELRAVPDDLYPLWDRCCEPGQALFLAWIDASNVVAEQLRERARPWGLAGLHGAAAEDRAAALTALPAAAAQDIYRTADRELREAKIAGVVAAYRAGSVVQREPLRAGERTCARRGCARGPGGGPGRFVPPRQAPDKAFCSDACRSRARGEDRPRPVLGSGLDE